MAVSIVRRRRDKIYGSFDCPSKERQYNNQEKKDNRTNNDLQALYRKLMIEEYKPH